MNGILLATINAKYIHASFGLRCLRANLGALRPRSEILEFVSGQRPLEMAEAILAREPQVLGLGVYIWNVQQMTELVGLLKAVRPGLTVVLGGPEVSHEWEAQDVVRLADHVVLGEGELAFAGLCDDLFVGRNREKFVRAPLAQPAQLASPYAEYTEEDLAHRLVYVEASRGCPFSCEFCLSSLDEAVRAFPLDSFLADMQGLLDRGLLHFKFVDRTFNLNLSQTRRILEFFLERMRPGLFLHFEMVPDRLPPELRELLRRFPAGTLQLEVGVQTFNLAAAEAISRRQDYAKVEDSLRFLKRDTQAHVHADLIAGLPGEDEESFGRGFDRLLALGPQEIQVGILKRLRGAPIRRHDREHGMVYSPSAPYEVLRTSVVEFTAMQRLRRFARVWDLIGNSGNFVSTTPMLWRGQASPFRALVEFSEWYCEKEGRHHAIALVRTFERVFEFLVERRQVPSREAALTLWEDYQRGGRGEVPPFLRPHLPEDLYLSRRALTGQRRTVKRQERHLSG